MVLLCIALNCWIQKQRRSEYQPLDDKPSDPQSLNGVRSIDAA